MGSRTDTTAQSEAAEIRTVAELLNLGLVAGQYPRNFPAADVYAFTPAVGRVVSIQVKYRHNAAASFFPLASAGSLDKVDFVVAFRANSGPSVGGRSAMQIWICPAPGVRPLAQEAGKRWVVRFSRLRDEWLFAWNLIADKAKEGA